jgi:L-ribulose-5-phosphate 4-epimerase
MGSLDDLKERVCKANLDLSARGLVLYTFGNVSGIDRDSGYIVIKPSGVSYEELTPDMMVTVDLENNVVDGEKRPSSDTRTHVFLYRNFLEIGGVAHTHSTYATSWAQARRPIPCLGTTHADYLSSEIPCTKIMSDKQIGRDYEEETGVQIVDAFGDYDYRYTPMVLVASHGPFTWGDSPEQAVYHSVILEELARMAAITYSINPDIIPVKRALIQKHFNRKHGENAYYGQKKEE